MTRLLTVLLLTSAALAAEKPAYVPADYTLVYAEDFETGGDTLLEKFVFGDKSTWKISEAAGNHFLEQHTMGKYSPKHRSPFNIALVQGITVGDCVIEADLMQTSKDYGHRDMVVLFGFRGPEHFYYTHMATKTDDHAHNIFIVNDAPRLKISTKTTPGIDWGRDVWKHVRVERKVSDGTIKVYWDDMTTPIQLAGDKTFDAGHVGFGTFDDVGRIDNIRIWAPGSGSKPHTLEPLPNYPPPAKPAAPKKAKSK